MFAVLPFLAGATVGVLATCWVKKKAAAVQPLEEKINRARQVLRQKTASGLEKLENQSAKMREKLQPASAQGKTQKGEA